MRKRVSDVEQLVARNLALNCPQPSYLVNAAACSCHRCPVRVRLARTCTRERACPWPLACPGPQSRRPNYGTSCAAPAGRTRIGRVLACPKESAERLRTACPAKALALALLAPQTVLRSRHRLVSLWGSGRPRVVGAVLNHLQLFFRRRRKDKVPANGLENASCRACLRTDLSVTGI